MPHKAVALARILEGIESLADFNQRLCRHLAAHSALEPIHHFPKQKGQPMICYVLPNFRKAFAGPNPPPSYIIHVVLFGLTSSISFGEISSEYVNFVYLLYFLVVVRGDGSDCKIDD